MPITLFGALVALAANKTAAPVQDEFIINTDFELGAYSKYVWRGINVVDDPVLQPSLTFSHGPWSVNFWGNYETTGVNTYYGTSTGKNRITEWDTTLSYTHSTESADFTLGIIHYDLPNTALPSTTEVFASVSLPSTYNSDYKWALTPFADLSYDLDEADGFYGRIGADYSFTPNENDAFSFTGWVGYADKNFSDYYYGNNKSAFADFGFSARYTRSFTETSFAYASLTFTGLLDKGHLQGASDRSNVVFGIGVGMSF